MNIEYKVDKIEGFVSPATVIFLASDTDGTGEGDRLSPFRSAFQPLIESGAFSVGGAEAFPLRVHGGWLILVGLKDPSRGALLESAARAAKQVKKLGLEKATFVVPSLAFSREAALEILGLALTLALDERPVYKSKNEEKPLKLTEVTLLDNGQGQETGQVTSLAAGLEAGRRAVAFGVAMAKAQLRARALTDRPANLLYPELLANEAAKLAAQFGVEAEVWDEKKLAQEGAGGILAVGSGSSHPPRMVILEYKGPGAPTDKGPTALVGKGITFDSGGLCIKPAENMGLMKTDMAGTAVVLSTVLAAAELKLPVHLVGVLPMAENLPDGGGYRPGDIITSLSGQTVEITNTDAEGRLILCDALAAAQRRKPSRILDLATLTGACGVALGENVAGFFCDDPLLLAEMEKAGREAAEDFWRLPLYEPYDERLKSDLADFKESGGRLGGAIIGALFLRRFIEPGLPWAHLDIVGTARNLTAKPHCPEGATGYGVRTFLKLLTA
ncbi:MAG: leucyl aminopeptidase [Deltaproteobacteria bacterium]|jgi:leucyl aminopeptidase|nr:leucyl aminopeptidase [Deltaproteobacteria bacterium]